jgi:TolB protein
MDRWARQLGLAVSATIGWATWSPGVEVFLDVTRSDTSRIPFSLVYLEKSPAPSGEGPPIRMEEIRTVLEADLTRSQVFGVIPTTEAVAELKLQNLTEPASMKRIGDLGVEAIGWIQVIPRGDEMTLEGRVYDGGTGAMVFGRRYRGRAEHLRVIVHRFSDEVVQRYTGERGIAQTRIAYTARQGGSQELYLMDYDGFNPRKITSDRSINLTPRWSPDGRWLTHTSYRDGNPDLYTLDLSSGQRRRLVSSPGLDFSPAWSPDGTVLAFASSRGGSTQIYLSNAEGKDLRRVTSGFWDDLSPAWSPTGNELVFTSNRGGSPQIYTMQSDGTAVRRLTFAGDYNTSPVWSPKGDWIAYTCRVQDRLRLCLISPDGTQARQLTEGAGEDEAPSWSPDGRHLVFSSTRDRSSTDGADLYRIAIQTGETERLTFTGAYHANPSWSPIPQSK